MRLDAAEVREQPPGGSLPGGGGVGFADVGEGDAHRSGLREGAQRPPQWCVVVEQAEHVGRDDGIDVRGIGADGGQDGLQVGRVTVEQGDGAPAGVPDPPLGLGEHAAAGVDADDAAGIPDHLDQPGQVQPGAAAEIGRGSLVLCAQQRQRAGPRPGVQPAVRQVVARGDEVVAA